MNKTVDETDFVNLALIKHNCQEKMVDKQTDVNVFVYLILSIFNKQLQMQ